MSMFRWSLPLIVLIALSARLYHFNYPIVDMHGFRQTQTASTIRNFYVSGIDLFHPKIDTSGEPGYLVLEFPLYQAMVAVLYKLFFPSEIWGRIASIIFGFVGALYLYRLVRLLLDEDIAILSIIFFLFAPLNIFYHRSIMIDPLVVALSLMFIFYAVVYIQENGKSAFWLALSFGIAAFTTKSQYVATLCLPIAYMQLKKSGLRKLLQPSFLALFLVPTVFLFAWQAYADSVNRQHEFSSYFVLSNPAYREWMFGTLDLRLNWSFYGRLADRSYFEILTTSGAPLFLIGVFGIFRKKTGWFFHLWLTAALLNYVIFANVNYVHNYYLLPLVPPIAIFCAAGLRTLYNWVQRSSTITIGIGTYRCHLATFLIASLVAYFIWFASTKTLASRYYAIADEHIVNGESIKAVSKPGELVLIAQPGGDWNPGTMYYAERRGYMTDLNTLTREKLDTFVRKGARYLAIIEGKDDENIGLSGVLVDFPLLMKRVNLSIYRLGESEGSK